MRARFSAWGFLVGTLWLQCALSAGTASTHVLKDLVETAVHSGRDAMLPPHLSVLLGISTTETSTPVRQLGFKNGDAVKTFNVCTADHHNVVLMSVAANHHAAAYLMSSDGELRKAFVYEVGGETRQLRLSAADRDFLEERKLWFERAPALGIRP